MIHTYYAPQTDDGWIRDVSSSPRDGLVIDVEFPIPPELDEATIRDHARFASRSRIARLGIDIQPKTPIELKNGVARLTATVRAVVPHYGIDDLLPEVFVRDLRVGRLVVCNPARQLSSEKLFEDYSANAFKLPNGFSIDSAGRFTIRSHKLIYDLCKKPTVDELLAILIRPEGKSLLNRLQVPRPVDNIVMEPGQGVITSCTMFLHRHFAVLESEPSPLGRHMHAVVLDPVTTRGPRIFLEFFNDSDTPIINPAVRGVVYAAEKRPFTKSPWNGALDGHTHVDSGAAAAEYALVHSLFANSSPSTDDHSYFNRAVAIVEEPIHNLRPDSPITWHRPVARDQSVTSSRTAQHRVVTEKSRIKSFGTQALANVPDDAQATVLVRHFPNLAEHLDLTQAATRGKVGRLVFQKASFEHGPFLSSRDHARLADYADLGLEVMWCNERREHLAVHVFRGHRGFFCEVGAVDNFKTALVIAVYGSSRELPVAEMERLGRLVGALHDFFGDDLAIMTGGGPGAMFQASRFARSHDLLVGASYLEIEDQDTNQLADFYQVFQENCRHSRQRWFEIAGFHIFCIGGVGTLEEIGITLTDIKLGLADGTPLVFFGHRESGLYWEPLVQQLRHIADEGRGPEWLKTHVLVTDDPEQVIAFYKNKLDLG